MRHLRQLPAEGISNALARGAIALRVGPYVYRIETNLPEVCRGLQILYGDFSLAAEHEFVDFDVAGVCNNVCVDARSFYLIARAPLTPFRMDKLSHFSNGV